MTAWFYSDNVKASMNGIDSISRENLYDSNGNMTVDGYHGLTLEYNTLGMVSRVKSGASTKVSYTYLADGTKVSALDASGNGLLYSGAMVFRKEGSVRSAESVGYSGGRFVADASGVLRPQIHVVDHLGSVRAIVDKSGNVVEWDSYYPYGERWGDGSIEQSGNRYRYNGKEEQFDFGLPYLDYGARMYDPATGRWLTQDPMAEKYYGISPYAFCAGNPMRYVDMDGMRWVDKAGNLIWAKEGWTSYASDLERNLGETLKATVTGRKQFEKLVNSPVNVVVSIDETTLTSKHGYVQYKGINYNNRTEEYLPKSDIYLIVFYKSAVRRSMHSKGLLSPLEAMAVNFGHEIEHTTPEAIKLDFLKAKEEDRERRPDMISNLLLKEYEMQKPLPQVQPIESKAETQVSGNEIKLYLCSDYIEL